jgi:SH3 domain protein
VNNLQRATSLLLILSGSVYAETIYLTDSMEFTLRATESPHGKTMMMLPSGTELELLHKNNNSGFSKVRTKDGQEGYVISRHTTSTPGSKVLLDQTNQKLASLIEENNILKEELIAIKGNNTQALTPNQNLLEERNRAVQELAELQAASSQTVQLKQQRDELQERAINMERELEQLKRENQSLQGTENQDWFLYGGAVAFTGILFGLILPKLGWRRRTSSWDSF